jgi:segregation and condensation protein B
MDRTEQRRIVEALVLASPEPISAQRLAELIPYVKPAKAKDLVNELNTAYQEQDRAFEIWEVAGGYQIRTRAEFSGYLQKLHRQRPMRLSRAALETLSIVAYKQPATRAEVEAVRGVECGPVLKSLLDRQLVRIAGHREVPGRPMVYGTTRRFLEVFGLESLKDMPALRELDELAREQGLMASEDVAPDGLEEPGAPELGDQPEIVVPDGAVDRSSATAPPDSEAAEGEPAVAPEIVD